MKKYLLFTIFLVSQTLAFAEILRVNCKSKDSDYSFFVTVDTLKKTVMMNDAVMQNVTISDSQIRFKMEIIDKK